MTDTNDKDTAAAEAPRPTTPFERGGYPTAVLDARETAAYLSISTPYVYELVRSGELPHTRVGKNLRFRLVDLDAYLEARTSREWKRAEGDGRGRPRKDRTGGDAGGT